MAINNQSIFRFDYNHFLQKKYLLAFLLALAASCSADQMDTLSDDVAAQDAPETSPPVEPNPQLQEEPINFNSISSLAGVEGTRNNESIGEALKLNQDGTVMIVGTPFRDGKAGKLSGHIKMYERKGMDWSPIGDAIEGTTEQERLGKSVAINGKGTIVAAGAYFDNEGTGNVQVYQNNGGTWNAVGEILKGVAKADFFGNAVSLSDDGKTLAIGIPGSDANGAVKVYQLSSGKWSQIGADIIGSASGARFGASVAINGAGNHVVIGAPSSNGPGKAYGETSVYKLEGSTWSKLGQTLYGEKDFETSGDAVDISHDGKTIVIGEPLSDLDAEDSGKVRVFKYIENEWQKLGQSLSASKKEVLGRSVSISGDGRYIALGGPDNTINAGNFGVVHVYKLEGDNWALLGNVFQAEQRLEQFGTAVDISGDGSTISASGPGYSGNKQYGGIIRTYALE